MSRVGSVARLFRLAAPAASAREAPTPLVLSSGLTHGAAAWARGGGGGGAGGLPAAAARAGFVVSGVDLPGWGRAASGWRAGAPLDELVDGLRAALAPLAAPPAVVAPSLAGPLWQKYLESWPLAALVLVSPLPPAPAALAARLRAAGGLAAALRAAAAGGEEAAAAAWLRAGDDGEALLRELEPLAMAEPGDGSRLCGADAAEALLARLAGDEPVRLEPSPVPLLAVFGAGDVLLTEEDKLATVHAHELVLAPGGALAVAASAAERAAVVAGDASVVSLAGGHDLLHGAPADAEAMATLIIEWLQVRF